MKYTLFFIIILIFSCQEAKKNNSFQSENHVNNENKDSVFELENQHKRIVFLKTDSVINVLKFQNSQSIDPKSRSYSGEVFINGKDTLVPVYAYNSDVWFDLKYASPDNFMGKQLYWKLKIPFVQKVVAQRLARCQTELTKQNPSLHLMVYDAVRPLSIQREMWNALDSIPVAERGKFVSNPANGSVHNYGCAIDITICSNSKIALDMGAGYDDIRKIAYPSLESQFLKSGDITGKQIENRVLLRTIMRSQGFSGIPTEWWHFNAFSRVNCKSQFAIIDQEF